MYRRLFEVVPSPKCTLVKVDNLSGANKVLQNRIIDKYDFVVLATRKMLPGDTESVQANGINYEDRVEADASTAGENRVMADDVLLVEAHKTFMSDYHELAFIRICVCKRGS